MSRPRLNAATLLMAAALRGASMSGEQFYTLASAQVVQVRGGTAIRLMTNGPVAFGALPDSDVPPGVARIRLRLYGVNAIADGVIAQNAVAEIAAVPDTRGNLDVTITARGTLDRSRPFELRAGRGPHEVDVVLRPASS